jgi:hypothetical protein
LLLSVVAGDNIGFPTLTSNDFIASAIQVLAVGQVSTCLKHCHQIMHCHVVIKTALASRHAEQYATLRWLSPLSR